MRTEPKPRRDGKCVECGKPKKRSRRAADGANEAQSNHTRQDRKMWLNHLDRDPFCCRPCLEEWYSIETAPAEQVCARPGCETVFTRQPNQVAQRFCSGKCRERDRKSPNFDIPGRCKGCAGDLDEYTKACWQCGDRRRGRARRKNPEYVAAELVRHRALRHGRRLKDAA